ncbi:hypothetical protein B0H19DRAFT_1061769 [Mycena capillaripes]|nr:hypothetical protein B0H19DRAFT_1061769 [Mycena capillaripes]
MSVCPFALPAQPQPDRQKWPRVDPDNLPIVLYSGVGPGNLSISSIGISNRPTLLLDVCKTTNENEEGSGRDSIWPTVRILAEFHTAILKTLNWAKYQASCLIGMRIISVSTHGTHLLREMNRRLGSTCASFDAVQAQLEKRSVAEPSALLKPGTSSFDWTGLDLTTLNGNNGKIK